MKTKPKIFFKQSHKSIIIFQLQKILENEKFLLNEKGSIVKISMLKTLHVELIITCKGFFKFDFNFLGVVSD